MNARHLQASFPWQLPKNIGNESWRRTFVKLVWPEGSRSYSILSIMDRLEGHVLEVQITTSTDLRGHSAQHQLTPTPMNSTQPRYRQSAFCKINGKDVKVPPATMSSKKFRGLWGGILSLRLGDDPSDSRLVARACAGDTVSKYLSITPKRPKDTLIETGKPRIGITGGRSNNFYCWTCSTFDLSAIVAPVSQFLHCTRSSWSSESKSAKRKDMRLVQDTVIWWLLYASVSPMSAQCCPFAATSQPHSLFNSSSSANALRHVGERLNLLSSVIYFSFWATAMQSARHE